ncbi:16S rRNA pseudouridine(516) synthase [Pseudazoarcus pumilus]|uniref:Pseudouridine synthase n=2 Tax=Pseudazoarcus pumilus TaxID=2067960 RepID=A0A2I6SAL3_9RHOO|nr:16S rRNA pseudouridine(516) synthase [Pseudazoarcus pumilus]
MRRMKIERLLQSQGFGTRRECRAMLRAGLVEIDGQTVDDPFAEVDAQGLNFVVDGEHWQYRERACLMLHKPLGYECSRDSRHHRSVFELLPPQLAGRGVQPVGRLDVDTTGLLLLSDDGTFIHAWSSGKRRIPKRYEVVTRHPVDDAMVATLLDGVLLRDERAPLRAAACERRSECALEMVVTEGKYHQVRRMVAAAGNRVEALHRSAIGGLELPADLPVGEWRWLGDADLQQLQNYTATPMPIE